MDTLRALRNSYHTKLGQQAVRFSTRTSITYPNFAGCSSRSSMLIANGIAEELGSPRQVPAQSAGALFERLTCGFIEHAFAAISHMRLGQWKYLTSQTQGSTGERLSGPVLAFQKPCCKRGVRVFCESALKFSSVSLIAAS